MDVTAIIVNYESWPDTVCLVYRLHEAAAKAPLKVEIVVVDNGSVPHPLSDTLEGLSGVRVLLVEQNVGFAAAVNLGWRASRGRFLLIMNPDLMVSQRFFTEVAQWVRRLSASHAASGPTSGCSTHGVRGALASPLQRARRPIGIVGFRLVNPDGTLQHSTGFFPKMWWTVVGQLFPRARRKYRPGPRRLARVDWVSGACFLADRAVFEHLGGMDDTFFLYYEEVDFCWRAWQRGWQVVHDPKLCVIHLHPLERRSVPPTLRVITRHSLLYYFQKNLPRWHFLSLAVVVWMQAVAGRMLATLVGRRRENRWVWQAVQAVATQMIRRTSHT
jgi:N-acetylglucosaminyl-diphospho-decaprenol L-rhamnosyltransferase